MQSIKLEHLMLQPGSEFMLISQVHWLRVPLHLTEGEERKGRDEVVLEDHPPPPSRHGLIFYLAVSS